MKIINIIKYSFFTFLSRLLGLLRDILLSRYLGAGVLSDAFFIAFKVPNLFRRLFAEGSMQSVFIPIFNNLLGLDEKRARQFAVHIFSVLVVSLLILLVVLEIYTKEWVTFISPGFTKSTEAFNLTVLLVRITLPYLVFISLATFYASILNSLNKFALTAFLPALLNIAIIVFLKLGIGNYAILASLGIVVGGALQLITVIYWCKKYNWFIFKLSFNFKDIMVKKFFKKLLPVTLGAGVYQINIIVDIVFASLLSFGTISYLFYADRIYQLPLSIIGIAIGSVLLPALSKKDISANEYSDTIYSAIYLALTFSLAATVGIMVFSKDIINVVYYGGNFGYQDVKITSIILFIYTLSLPFNILIKIMLPIFYARGDVKSPLYTTIFSLILNIVILYWFVVVKNDMFGLAYATVVASITNFIVLFIIVQFKYTIYFNKNFILEIKKIFIISCVLLAFCLLLKFFILNNQSITVTRILMIIIVILTFIMLMVLLKLFNTNIYSKLKLMFKGAAN